MLVRVTVINRITCCFLQTLSEFNSLYHEVVRRGINSQNNLEEFADYIFPYAYQCNEATLAYAYALSKTIAGKFIRADHKT